MSACVPTYSSGGLGAGGLTLVGGRHLDTALRAQRLGTPTERRAYFITVWITLHEWLHVLGLPHYQGDPTNDDYADLTLTNYGSRERWYRGTMATVGLLPHELEIVRTSPWVDYASEAEYVRLYPADRRDVVGGETPAHWALGAGLTLQEYGVA